MPGPHDRWLVAAASLWERLDAIAFCRCKPPCSAGADAADLAAVVQELGGAEHARRWFSRAGVTDRCIEAVLAPQSPLAGACVTRHIAGLPWAACARDSLEALGALDPRAMEPPFGTTLPLFPEISAQLVRAATRHVEAPSRPGFAGAFASARLHLWRELGRLIQHPLATDFQAFRAETVPRPLRAGVRHPASTGAASRMSGPVVEDDAAAYRCWLTEVRDIRGRALASDYPVLFRLVGEAVAAWAAATPELFDRLERDWADLATTFGFDPAAPLDDAIFGLSDPHDGRRQVACLRVGDRTFFYKPRSFDGEELWHSALRMLAASEDRAPYHSGMGASPMLVRDGYGYVADAPQGPIERDRIEEYHRELGAVLALFYAMNGTDGHMQNLVVSRGHPVIVDLETLLDAPTSARELPGSGLSAATQGWAHLQSHSVATTGLLPLWVEWEDRVVDHSAIGAYAAENDLQAATRILVENPGSMSVRIWEQQVTEGSAPSIPWCDGEEVAATDHVDAVRAGFQDGYHCIMGARASLARLCATGSSTPSVRQVLRPTRRYAAVANWLLAPRWLNSGVARTAAVLQALHEPWMDRSDVWPRVIVAEARALDRGDIPLFTARVDASVLLERHGPIGPWLAATPLDALRAKLDELSEADLALQDRMIRLSFAARVAGGSPHPLAESSTDGGSAVAAYRQAVDAPGLDHVDVIVDRLREDAVQRGGGCNWLTLAYDPQTERYEYRLADHGVFAGSAGTALFLSVASADAAAGALAMRALTSSVQRLAGASDLTASDHALSLLRTAYAAAFLARCGLGDDAVHGRIEEAVASIEPSVLREDRHLDALFGCASGLLASTRAGEMFGWARLRDCADACSETLLSTQELKGAEAGGWRTDASPDRCLTGFSHGAAGIVQALAATGARDEGRVAQAVELGLQFESRCFDGRTTTWRRALDADSHGVSWCHGAPGIGLARVGMIRAGWDEVEVREHLIRALDAARRHVTPTDTFCCGAAGVAELFLSAGDVLNDPDVAEEGRALLASTVLQRRPAHYRLGLSTNTVCHPGLYQGAAGIAYMLVRARNPAVPSFALWELPEASGSGGAGRS